MALLKLGMPNQGVYEVGFLPESQDSQGLGCLIWNGKPHIWIRQILARYSQDYWGRSIRNQVASLRGYPSDY